MNVEGTVEARNERGIKVGGEWRNLSQFHPLELPEVGAHVKLELDDKRGFLTAINVLQGAPTQSARDEKITRLAVLKAAANFAAPRPQIKSADVLELAERWLRWANDDE